MNRSEGLLFSKKGSGPREPVRTQLFHRGSAEATDSDEIQLDVLCIGALWTGVQRDAILGQHIHFRCKRVLDHCEHTASAHLLANAGVANPIHL